MKVYLESKQDWIDFVNGRHVTAYIYPVKNFYKEILVAYNEVVSFDCGVVTIEKKY